LHKYAKMTVYCHIRMNMQAVNYTNARNNLKTLIDDACDNDEEIIITTKNDKSVVLISLDEYNRTHAALKREVQESIKEIQRGDIIDIEEAFDKVLAKYEN